MGKTKKHSNNKRKTVKNKHFPNNFTSYPQLDSGIKLLYSLDDYNSNDGMLTSVWGPSMWHFLHTMSFNYPVKPTKCDKINYYKFIYSLRNILPCGKCRKNLKTNFQKLPLKMSNMESRATFSLYIYNLHELINNMLGKKSNLTYDMVRDRYEHFRARCVRNAKILTPKKNEKGCVEPLYGQKTKCVLRIVPQTEKCDSFEFNNNSNSA
jgi:Erv1 / Alr family